MRSDATIRSQERHANREFLRSHGVDLTERQFYDWFLCRDSGAWPLLRARGWSEADLADGRRRRDALYRDRLAAGADLIKPGMRELVRSFSGRARMAVVTSSSRADFDRIHRRSGICAHLEEIVAAGDYRNAKPDPEPYLVALDRLAVPATWCIAVEDSPRGLQAARAAGLACIAVQTELTRDHPFADAWAVVETACQLADALERWLSPWSAARF